jgi:MOSC domain-containing protein YiiM
VNVGLPRAIEWQGRRVRSSIFKAPVTGTVRVGPVNLEGDRQADLTVHGGVIKAVYAYPAEHYGFWLEQLAVTDLPWGAFGENLSIEGLLETKVRIGDHLTIGTAEFAVTQPRMPCFKLGMRHGRPDLVKRFEQAGRPGFYLSVVRPGELAAGNEIALTRSHAEALTVAEVARLRTARRPDRKILERAAGLEGLAPDWQDHFRKQIEQYSPAVEG